jgi:predicted Zn finger-like uncharacterized protein
VVVKCPNCLSPYRINTAHVTKPMVRVKCPSCGQFVMVNLKKATEERKEETNPRPTLTARDVLTDTMARGIREMLTINVDGRAEPPRVLIADEPRAFREFLRKSLEEIGCRVTLADDGTAVEKALRDALKPHVVFMNVVLKGSLGFVLCEQIKNDLQLKHIKVVLIGAIYRMDRFRRDPSNMYGADDYIEEIIVKHDLQERMRKLLGVELETVPEREQGAPADVVEYARRLARIILSDIVIYNKDRVDEYILSDTFEAALGEEIEEGKEYFLEKIHSDRPEVYEIYQQTIEEYLKRRKRELESGRG